MIIKLVILLVFMKAEQYFLISVINWWNDAKEKSQKPQISAKSAEVVLNIIVVYFYHN